MRDAGGAYDGALCLEPFLEPSEFRINPGERELRPPPRGFVIVLRSR